MSDHNCLVKGNPDLYGLGIRLGIYFQMLTVQSSGLFSYFLRAEDNIAETAVVFVMSVGTVLVRQIVNRDIEAIEVAFMITLLTALVNSYRQANQLKGLVQMLYGIEMLGLIGIYIWFWWVGMDQLKHSCPDDRTFFFANVSLWGWFRTFNKVLTVFAGLAGAMSAMVYGVAYTFLLGFYLHRAILRAFNRPVEPIDQVEQYTNDYRSVDLALNIGVILFVELTIRWNQISDVHSLNSPGQFIPFFIGLAQLMSVGYKAIKNYLKNEADEEDPGRRNPYTATQCLHESGHTRQLQMSGSRRRYTGNDTEMNSFSSDTIR